MKRYVAIMLTGIFLLMSCTTICSAQQSADTEGYDEILSKDDFDTAGEYQEYINNNPVAMQQFVEQITAEARVNSVNKLAQHRYTLVNLSHTGLPIQKAFIDGNYIYLLRYSKKDYPDRYYMSNNSYLSRYYINWDNFYTVYMDCMVLQNFGHGQTFESFNRNGNTYFWVACKANESVGSGERKYATQIGRMKYTPGAMIDYTSIPRLSHIAMANNDVNNNKYGTVKRTDAALSPDGTTLFIWMRNTDGNIQASFYNASKINSILDNKENDASKSISCGSSSVMSACKSYCRNSLLMANASFQGVDIDNNDNMYIIGGKSGESPTINKFNKNGTLLKSVKVTGTQSTPQFPSMAEPQGIQLLDGYLYFVNYKDYSVDATGELQYIYSIPKSYLD